MPQLVGSADSWKTVLTGYSLEARIRLLPRVSAGIVALLCTLAIAGPLTASRRLADLQQHAVPTLQDARTLSTILARIDGDLGPAAGQQRNLMRADSLAERFHAVARSSRSPSLVPIDARFGDWFALARRDGATRDAASVHGLLTSELASNEGLAQQEITEALEAASTAQSWLRWSLFAVALSALPLLALLGRAVGGSIASSIEALSAAIETLSPAQPAVTASPSARADVIERAHGAVRRHAQLLREHVEMAKSLASGSLRHSARAHVPGDPLGLALREVAESMGGMSAAARRVARGDLDVTFTPRSKDDTVGHAHLAMLQRITASLQDANATQHGIASLVQQLRGDAAALATSVSGDADILRKTIDQVAMLTAQSRSAAARGAMLTERASESDVMLRRGAAAFEASRAGLTEVVRKSAIAQRLARSAGHLAVRASMGASDDRPLEEEARAIAAEAAATMRTMVRTVVDGSEQAHLSGIAVDHVAIALREGTSLVREVSASSSGQASTLAEIDASIVRVQGSTARSAETARSLASGIDALASHARRLDAILGRFRSTNLPAITALPVRDARSTPAAGAARQRSATGVSRLALS